MKTIKQIADEIGVSKQAVAKRMKKEPLVTELIPHVENTANGKQISDEGVTLILTDFRNNRQPTVATNRQPTADNRVVDILQEQLTFLQGQLTTKDKQITDLTAELAAERQYSREQIATLTAALVSEQALHAGTIHKQLGTTEPPPPVEADATDREDSASSTEGRARADDIEAEKTNLVKPLVEPISKIENPGFISRLFKKRKEITKND